MTVTSRQWQGAQRTSALPDLKGLRTCRCPHNAFPTDLRGLSRFRNLSGRWSLSGPWSLSCLADLPNSSNLSNLLKPASPREPSRLPNLSRFPGVSLPDLHEPDCELGARLGARRVSDLSRFPNRSPELSLPDLSLPDL